MFDCDVKTDMQAKALRLLCKCADKAEAKGYRVPKEVFVDFSLNSVNCAGMAGQNGVHEGVRHEFQIQLHGKALEFYKEGFYNTIIHEFCHILQFINRPSEQAHGYYFYGLMELMGVEDPKRCHSYNLYEVTGKKKRRQRRWEYKCLCEKAHSVATVTHNKMQNKGQVRECRTCKARILWTGKELK